MQSETLPYTMKAMQIERYGKHCPVQENTVPLPVLGRTDVLVEIRAASVNPIDLKIRNGGLKSLLKYTMPLTLGSDFAGVVVAVGRGVRRFKVGDEVYGCAERARIGSFAEYIAANEKTLAFKPRNLNFAEAASIPLVGLTVWQIFRDIGLRPNQKVLIHAGAGGIGSFAVQLANHIGAYTAATASGDSRYLVHSLGADRVIDYKTEPFQTLLSNYDAVLDTIGGDTLKHSFLVLKPGGTVVSIASMPTAAAAAQWGAGLAKQGLFSLCSLPMRLRARRLHTHYTFHFVQPHGADLQRITDLIEAERIRPVIDHVFPFAETQNALEYAALGRTKGKVVVAVKEGADEGGMAALEEYAA
ncbi:NADP-dependent oxidoreductase [Neisseria sp.]|uniref:NADP-dependent oxidoreductase n=1 Tax=Neisseria sp. TaxID=192066 RepID=UPI00359F606F